MPRIDLTTLIRDLALEPIPVAATVKVQARDARGPYVSIDGDKVIFSRQRDIVLRPGQPQQIDVPPTDGAHFCWISVAVGTVEREWTLSVPDTTDVVPFGALMKVNPDTYQPTEDVLAEWDILRQDSYRARADAVAAAGVAEGHASDAAGFAGAAASSAGSAASSAGDAAGSAGSAAGSAGHAAGFAGAASESAGQASGAAGRASDSASAAAESQRKAGLSASAAATSESNASTHAGTASTKANEASTSASTASTKAGEAADSASSAGQSKATVEQLVQTATFLFVQQGDQPPGVLNLADAKTNAIIHRRLTGNVTGITLPTVPTPGQMITLVLTQDATGGRTLTIPAAIFTHEGLDPVLSTTAGAVDMIGMVYDGIRWWAMVPAQRGA
ncbi:hypothetical protein [Microbacterium testaceum]|uniref:hypothetical protein n=1 Tax=Microbacterium testaceum TaxID=2033 RepID=UPI000734D74F|nr:hypothetical protein [Microbacterium testaceum]